MVVLAGIRVVGVHVLAVYVLANVLDQALARTGRRTAPPGTNPPSSTRREYAVTARNREHRRYPLEPGPDGSVLGQFDDSIEE